MSNLPTMDQYNDAVQHPQTAFTDSALKAAKIAINGMGLPVALGGGFALTYTATAQGRKYAIRCFHKEAKGLEARYGQIDKGLRAAGGPYFVGFEYQPTGVVVNGGKFPIVKMDWAEGDTLGSFLEDNYSDRTRVEKLRTQFVELERFLRSKGIAHGDLQNLNVLVKSDLRLIDYDGMYVSSLPIGQGTELGHKHFQHPMRTASDYGPNMDRFSFILIELSLRAVAQDPKLFSKHSTGENILLGANDFADPGGSAAFANLKAIPALTRDATNLANICAAPFKGVPSLEDFLAGRNIPAAAIVIRTPSEVKATPKEAAYIGAYDVVDAQNFGLVAKQVGNRIELVGMVTKMHIGRTKYGKPYYFVFFNSSRQSVKLNIWSDGLKKLTTPPSQAWVGTWFSVQGLVDPAYTNRYGTSLSITVTANSQLRKITESEARHRLKNPSTALAQRPVDNQSILAGIGANPRRGQRTVQQTPPRPQAQPSVSRNQAILNTIKQGRGPTPAPQSPPTPSPPYSPKKEVPWGWIIFGVAVALVLIRSLSG